MASVLFVLLWLLIFIALWYSTHNMWISIAVSFVISWILRGILQELGYHIPAYDYRKEGTPTIDLKINARIPWQKRIIGIFVPLDKKDTPRARVKYLYEGSDTWPLEAKWKETGTDTITIETDGDYELAVWKVENHTFLGFDSKPLPPKFTLDIELLTPSNICRSHFQIPLEID